jgi:hypothetical protein
MVYQLAAGARAFRRVLTPLQRQAAATIRILLVCYIGLALLMTSTIRQTPLVDRVQMSVVLVDLIPNGLLLAIAVAYALGAARLASKGVLIQQAKLGEQAGPVSVAKHEGSPPLACHPHRRRATGFRLDPTACLAAPLCSAGARADRRETARVRLQQVQMSRRSKSG